MRDWIFVGSWLVAAGCIDGGARPAADVDTAQTTSADGVTSSDAVDDGDTGDTGGGDATEPECHDDDECIPEGGALGCDLHRCDNGTCEHIVIGEGDACDDGDACTANGTCVEGACTGVSIACGSDDPCFSATGCDPESGCVLEPTPAGTLCDDGVGQSADACVDGWYGPEDHCDGEGRCVGGIFHRPQDHPLGGRWYTVMSSGATSFATLHADLDFDDTGGLTVANATSPSPSWVEGMEGGGYLCASPNGRVDFGRPTYNFAGYTNPEADVLVFLGYAAGEIGIAVRPDGGADDVDGTYQMVSTAALGNDAGVSQLVTWVGTMTFDDGCISSRTSFATTPTLPVQTTFWYAEGTCVKADGDTIALDITLLDGPTEDASTGFPITWRGAVAQGGDLLVLTRDLESGDAPMYGTILLVRHAADLPGRIVGGWSATSQVGGGGPATHWGYLDVPALGDGEPRGWLLGLANSALRMIEGGWAVSGADGRYSHRLVLDQDILHHGGWLSPRGDFIMGWLAPPVSSEALPRFLGAIPAEGSLLLMVREMSWQTASPDDDRTPPD